VAAFVVKIELKISKDLNQIYGEWFVNVHSDNTTLMSVGSIMVLVNFLLGSVVLWVSAPKYDFILVFELLYLTGLFWFFIRIFLLSGETIVKAKKVIANYDSK
jgi:hypothetical protein